MRKGESTRRTILDHALALSSRLGLRGLTIGRLAKDLELSKSGLFGHFKSKESLQLQVLELAAEDFLGEVVRPAFRAPDGEPRIRKLFENWVAWTRTNRHTGGCPFVQFGFELDDSTKQAIRDYLARHPRAGDRVHRYSLEQFGLSPVEQRKRYADYCDRFEIARED